MKKLLAPAFVTVILIFSLCACGAETPEDAAPYSDAAVTEFLEQCALGSADGETADFSACFYQEGGIEDETVDAVINSAINTNAIVACFSSQLEWSETHINDECTRLDLTVTYRPDAPDGTALVRADTALDAAMGAISLLNNGQFTVDVLYDGKWDENELGGIMSAAYSNADCPTPFDVYYYEYPVDAADGERVYELVFDSGVDAEAYDGLLSEQNAAVSALAASVSSGDKKSMYTQAHNLIIGTVEYDDDLCDSITEAENSGISAALGEGYTAYGALVEGTSVCNGYAMAYKQLCDALGLDCWVVIGEGDGESHAWNVVRLGGETYLVDCTWDDTAETSRYLLAAEGSKAWKEHDADDSYVLAW